MMALALFLLSAGFVVYIVFLYPRWLAMYSRTHARPVRKSWQDLPTVSVIIAVHNGARFLEAKLRSVLALDYPKELLDIIVASDGSTDETVAIAESFASQGVHSVQVERGGKPRALNAAMQVAQGDVLLFSDVRQPLDPPGLRELIANLADPEVGAVSGKLVILKGSTQEEANISRYWRYEFSIRTHQSELDSIFGATGAYYAMRRTLTVPIPEHILLDDVYLPLNAFFRGYRLVVEPRAQAFDFPTNLDVEFRRKVRTLSGNYQVLAAYPQLLGPGNRMWLHYLSHKFGRLLLPFAFLTMAVSSLLLPWPLRAAAAGGQAAFYLLALVDPWVREGQVLKRASGPARTLVVMMAATLCAVSILFVPAAKLWAPAPASKQS